MCTVDIKFTDCRLKSRRCSSILCWFRCAVDCSVDDDAAVAALLLFSDCARALWDVLSLECGKLGVCVPGLPEFCRSLTASKSAFMVLWLASP